MKSFRWAIAVILVYVMDIMFDLLYSNLLQKKQAYFDYMVTITIMLGTNNTVAKTEMQDVLEFETKVANVSENIFW